MDELLKPIKEQFADFKKSVEESKTQNEVNKKELQSTFEATMKLFQQEQQQAVTSLKEQTSKIGSDAANLTKALKGDSKMQGDWGEMVLETILENSGLRKDEEFFIQENTKDENGKNFRPDVIVRFQMCIRDSIYGPSGSGKTHLVNAIGLKTKQMYPQKRVLYVSARLFQTQYTDAVLHNASNDFINFSLSQMCIRDSHKRNG